MQQDIIPMVWNEPGNEDKSKNPWGRRDTNGPPDLDEVFSNLKKRFLGLFGKQSNGSSFQNNSFNIQIVIMFAVIAIVILYVLSGFYTVASYEQGVITRFGKYHRTVTSGLHWVPRFMDQVQKVNTENLKASKHSGWMLTKDENIIQVEMEVQYRVIDAERYLFNVALPDDVLSQAADSALRQVIGDSTADDVLTNKKQQIAQAIKEQLIDILSLYDAGFYIEAVNFRDSRPPEDVKDAFDDVTKSREDRERLKHQAEAYANSILPQAEGAAKKIIAEAEAYKERVILDAAGEAQRFNLILPGYQRAPHVTKTRMYIEAMEEVFSNTTKIIVNGNASNNMIYVPLDKIIGRKQEQVRDGAPYLESAEVVQNVSANNNKKEKR